MITIIERGQLKDFIFYVLKLNWSFKRPIHRFTKEIIFIFSKYIQ
jgi:hypothetical protein